MSPEPDGKVSFGAWKLEGVPRWALACATLAAVVIGAWWTIGPTHQELISQQEANASLQSLVDEMGKHFGEAPEAAVTLMDDERGSLTASRYRSDNCTLLVRTAAGKAPRTRLIPDMATDTHSAEMVPDTDDWLAAFAAAGARAEGQCLAYHPGPFRWWQGAKNGCAVDIWREWPDGCQHVQTIDVCHDGVAGPVRWTNCVH